jgi:hypothetical protein
LDTTSPEETAAAASLRTSSFPAGQFPANWINANPQVSAANYYTNTGTSNYHSLQLQSTIRANRGVTFQGTYVWSRALALGSGGYTNPADRNKDYNLATNHVTHDFRANGTFALPFGPNHCSSGARPVGSPEQSKVGRPV